MQYRAKFLGIAIACLAFGAQALTLGRVHGAALIGQPLSVSVEIQLDAGEDVAALCLDAEVFQADVRQDAGRVRLLVETATAGTARVRLTSSALIEEPVVSFNLRTGCGQKTMRRYVLLADLPGEVAAPAAPLVLPVAAPAPPASGPSLALAEALVASAPEKPVVVPAVTPVASAKISKPTPAKPRVQRRAHARDAKLRRGVAASKRSAAPVKAPAKAPVTRPAGGPHLKLDALALLPDRAASAAPAAALPATPEALLNSQKVQQLEGDVKALRDSAAKSEATLVDLKARLQKAEAERRPAGLVYGLVALLLASVLAAVSLWLRQRRTLSGAPDWWSAAAANGAPMPPAVAAPAQAVAPVVQDPARGAESAASVREAAEWPSSLKDSVFSELMAGGAPDAAAAEALANTTPASAAKPVRRLASEAVWKLRRQAQQFVSQGNGDQAVQVLKQQIRDSKEPNPFVYLDLLGLLHSLRLQADFNKLRQDFSLLFNADVPEFMAFREQGKSLDAYAPVLSKITGLWPKPEVQVLIESCIFRDPWNDRNQPFDLAAFRELLKLQVIAQRESETAPAFPELARSAAAALPARAPEPAPASTLDLDLSDAAAPGAAAAAPQAHIDLTRLIPGDHEHVLTSMAELGGSKSGR